MFGDPPAETPPAETPATESSLDDLFGQSPTEVEKNDLFGETDVEVESPVESAIEAEVTPAAETVSETSLDDLFGAIEALAPTTPTYEAELPAPVVAEPADAEPVVAEAETGGNTVISTTSHSPADPFADTQVRTWTDNTGTFTVEGRLFQINEANVRLLKTNGRTCTVPNGRLSDADAAYVDALKSEIESARITMLTSR